MAATLDLTDAYIADRCARHDILAGSVPTFRYTLRHFAGFCPDTDRLDTQMVEGWLADRGRVVSAKTLYGNLSTLRGFCRWLVRRSILTADPTVDVPSPKLPRATPRTLRRRQVDEILRACCDERERLIAGLMLREGLRDCEVARLERGDVDYDGGTLHVVGKGNHERILPLLVDVEALIDDYRASVELGDAPGPLIRSLLDPGAGVGAARIYWIMRAVIDRASLRATPHQLRHTFAARMLRRGANLRQIQNALGHASIVTTQIYLPLTESAELRQVMD